MQNSNSKKIRPNFYKSFKHKVFFSNNLKKALFKSFLEAKNRKTYIDLNILLYGILSQSNSLATNLLLNTISRSKNQTTINLSQIQTRLLEFNAQKTSEILQTTSIQSVLNSQKLPQFTPEVREILKKSLRASLKTNKKICVITTKDVFFELISCELVRDLLYQTIN